MEKIAKYYLSAEGIVLLGVLLLGFYDPSLWLFGVMFVGIIVSLAGLIISWIWCRSRLRSKGLVIWPFTLAVGNAVLFICLIIFILLIFSGGINFLM